MTSAHAHKPSHETVGGFGRFSFHSELVRGLDAAEFRDPRPIQLETIPACLEGRDVLGLAQTGTGKTAAFALPILQGLLDEPGRGPLVLVLAPTRELAIQIDAEIRCLAQFTSIETVTVFGGVSASGQIRALRRSPEIVVGCPGRVLDLLNQGTLDLSGVDTLVLDEADHMFDMGFLPDIKRILSRLPGDRQNLLFSATMPKAIRSLADRVLDRPHVVELAPSAPAERIEHALYSIESGRKRGLLDRVLDQEDCRTAIVFTRTKHRAKRMAQQLAARGHKAVALQGNMSQSQRDRAMGGFRQGRFEILVATDIAARGLDVAGVDYVINFDPPSTPETYTHRIGRTGRSDASGKALTFVTSEDRDWLRDTERMLGEPIPRLDTPEIESSARASSNGRSSKAGGRSGPTSKRASSRRRRADGASSKRPASKRAPSKEAATARETPRTSKRRPRTRRRSAPVTTA